MCGYHGCHVVPPAEGCKCTGCTSYTARCENCAEPRKRADKQFANDDFHFEIRKCQECKKRAADMMNTGR